MAEIQDIVDQLVVLQKAVAVPSGERDIQDAFDEPPESIGQFPVFVNLEEEGEGVTHPSNWGYVTYTIGMHLLLAPANAKYSFRSLRKWVRPVIAHFSQLANRTLAGTADFSWIRSFNFDPFDWDGTEYVAVNFRLEAQVQEDWG